MHSFYELMQLMQPQDKFIVTTVDTIFREEDFKKYVDYFQNSSKEIDGVMGVTTYIDDEKPLYVAVDSHDTILSFDDNPPQQLHPGVPTYISAGIYGLRKSALPVLEKCIHSGINRMRNFQRQLVENGLRLKAFDLGKVLDVDHMADIEKANSFIR